MDYFGSAGRTRFGSTRLFNSTDWLAAQLCLKSLQDHVTLSVAKGLGWWGRTCADVPLPRFFGLRASE